MNRLLVSSYVFLKKIEVTKNKNILKHLIDKKDKEEYKSLTEFTNLIKNVDRDFDYEALLELFEFVISPSDKLVNGAIYTPKDIREYITKESFKVYKKEISNAKIVDISCGCGGFLIDATKILKIKTDKTYKQIYKDNIFGVDIQKYSIERTEILLTLLAIEENEDEKEFKFNLYDKDSLEFDWKKENKIINKNDGFDIILGNPPYVCSRNMDDKTKSLMSKWDTCSTGHPDLYIPFFEIGYNLLNQYGILGYITVNSFIKSVNGRAIRKFFQDKKTNLSIIDFEDEQIFNSRMTYTCICFISKEKSERIKYKNLKKIDLTKNFTYEEHLYSDIDNPNGWYIKNRDLVKKIESIGTPFGEIYNTKSGIATLKNSVYIFKPIKTLDGFHYLDENVKIEEDICKDIINSNFLVNTDKKSDFIEKIIFPYYYDKKDNYKVKVIEENKMRSDYPYAFKYLESYQDELATRDKGKGKDYKYWYAFGRNQSLERTQHKLLFPQLAKKGFKSAMSSDKNLYFYNGMAAMSNDEEELLILQQIFKSEIFWIYVKSIGKPYASNYLSLGRNYMKNFGIYNFTDEEKKYLIQEKDIDRLNEFLNSKYIGTPL